MAQGAVRYSLSKTIKLQIVPATPEWQNEKFRSILTNLDLFDQPLPQAQPGESSQAQAEHREELFENARDDLKYLATPAAIDEMTLRLRSEKYNFADHCSIGLMGLPPMMRETAIASMNKRIEEPDFPITLWFFSTFAFLHVTPGSDKESIRKQREAIDPIIWSATLLRRHKERTGGESGDGANPAGPWTRHLDSSSEPADGFAAETLFSRSG